MKKLLLISGLVLGSVGIAWASASAEGKGASAGGDGIASQLGNAITYQGKLDKNGAPVNGTCNFTFALYNALSGGTQVGPTLSVFSQQATNGQFSASLDFGSGVFDGQARWLLIQVQGPGDAGFTTLSPRQPITAAPYSLFSLGGAGGGSQWIENSGHLTYSGGNVGVISHAGAFPAGDGVFMEGNWGTVGHLWSYNYNTNTANSLVLNAPGGNVGIGTTTPASRLEIAAQNALSLTGFQPYLTLKDTNSGGKRTILAGGNGDLGIYPDTFINGNPAVLLKNTSGWMGLGTTVPNGRLHAVDANGSAVIGQNVGNWVGVYGEAINQAGVWGKSFNAIGVYGESQSATGFGGYFRNNAGGEALHVDGKAAVKTLQILGGADLAERFEADEKAEPGTVMSIDPKAPGHMRVADEPYCRRVAGVVSGAKSLAAGVILGTGENGRNELPIALTGRVWVKCDATRGAIHPGDLLTTSDRRGHAMLAGDPARASGAILGKAMTSLEAGTGTVLVLVSLQ